MKLTNHLVVALALFSTAALAQGQRCGDTEASFKNLKEKYGERMVLISKSAADEDHVISVWVNTEHGTGTVIKSSISRNISCIIDELEQIKPVSSGTGV